jgi:hypothetical protein
MIAVPEQVQAVVSDDDDENYNMDSFLTASTNSQTATRRRIGLACSRSIVRDKFGRQSLHIQWTSGHAAARVQTTMHQVARLGDSTPPFLCALILYFCIY